MENLWLKSHKFIIDSKIGDYYFDGNNNISVIKRTPKKIYFSNGNIVSLKFSKIGGFYHLTGKNVNQILRDIEGYFIYLIH